MKQGLGLKGLSLLMVVLCVSGCATIYGRQNDEQRVFFNSNVAGTKVTCGGKSVMAPGNLDLKQSKTHTCTAFAEGFEEKTFRVKSGVSDKGLDYSTDVNMQKWGIWTLGLGMLAAWPVDFLSGSMKNLKEDRYTLELQPEGTTGKGKKVLNKTWDVGKALVTMPTAVAGGAAGTVLDTTVRSGSQQVGISSTKQRKEAEQTIEGKKIVERLEGTMKEEGSA